MKRKNKKAAISTEMIVYVAIAVFVLVIIIGFATGAFQKLFRSLEPKGEVGTAQDKCENLCAEAEDDVLTGKITDWRGTSYCSKTFAIDINEDGEPETLHCWDNPIDASCSFSKQLPDGTLRLCSNPDPGETSCGVCTTAGS